MHITLISGVAIEGEESCGVCFSSWEGLNPLLRASSSCSTSASILSPVLSLPKDDREATYRSLP